MLRHLGAAAVALLICCQLAGACIGRRRHTATIQDTPMTPWTEWSFCDNKCGEGQQVRWRTVINLNKQVLERRQCMRVDGCEEIFQWTEWSGWSTCSQTCNGGSQSRTRSCLRTDGGFADANSPKCSGSSKDVRQCGISACPTEPPYQWTQWSHWSPCSQSCGEASKTRTRSCKLTSKDSSKTDSSLCPGDSKEVKQCNIAACPTTMPTPSWSSWSSWTTCSTSCGAPGIQARSRNCQIHGDDVTKTAASSCPGPKDETRECQPMPKCPVYPEWQAWNSWSPCSSSCGTGSSTRTRIRNCILHDSQSEWIRCVQPNTTVQHDNRPCHLVDCPPTDGRWGSWMPWSPCLASCGHSMRVRNRHCDDPQPQHGGLFCPGDSVSHETCLGGVCPVDGQWGAWAPCDNCNSNPPDTCSSGTRRYCRNCDNPKPEFGGTACLRGLASERRECWNVDKCDNSIVHPPMKFRLVGFSNTTDVLASWRRAPYGLPALEFPVWWSENGSGDRPREAVIPKGKELAIGEQYEYWLRGYSAGQQLSVTIATRGSTEGGQLLTSKMLTKTIVVSRVDGGWGPWSHWGPCRIDGSSGQNCNAVGKYRRTRLCNNPVPANGGSQCQGDSSETEVCFNTC